MPVITEDFERELQMEVANNEDQIRERVERLLLDNEEAVQDYLELESIDTSKHSPEEIREHLDKEVNKVLEFLYDDMESGKAFQVLEQLLEKAEAKINVKEKVNDGGEFFQVMEAADILSGELLKILKGSASIGAGGLSFALGIITFAAISAHGPGAEFLAAIPAMACLFATAYTVAIGGFTLEEVSFDAILRSGKQIFQGIGSMITV